MRGLTSAGRKSRGFKSSGHRAKKRQGGSWRAKWKSKNTKTFKRYR
jgi:ribosomal protein L15E